MLILREPLHERRRLCVALLTASEESDEDDDEGGTVIVKDLDDGLNAAMQWMDDSANNSSMHAAL